MIAEIVLGGPVFGDQNPVKWPSFSLSKTSDDIKPIWSKRSEVVERLLAQKCELCGSTHNIEAHHIRKLADLERKGQRDKPEWARVMAARRRKTLVVCQICHNQIHAGRYDGPALSKKSLGRAV